MKSEKIANLKIRNTGAANQIKCYSLQLLTALALLLFQGMTNADQELEVDNIQIINESVSAIQKYSIHSLDNDSATHAAIQGVIESLDPYSQLLTPEQYKNITTLVLSDNLSLGVTFKHTHKGWEIATLDEDSSAAKGGLNVGDILLAIDETSVSQSLVGSLNKTIQSKPSTLIDIIRDNKRRRFQINNNDLSQAKVSSSWLADDSILLLKIPFFAESTPGQIKELITPLTDSEAEGIIIDLRNNSGGLLPAAIDTADLFLNKGKIVSIKGKTPEDNIDHFSRQNSVIADLPIIVLVNKRTASSAEILTAALQENKRAHIVGQKTYGKGSVQALVPLSDGYAIKLTTAFYYSPKGNRINGRGVNPNLTVADLDSPGLDENLLMSYLIKQF